MCCVDASVLVLACARRNVARALTPPKLLSTLFSWLDRSKINRAYRIDITEQPGSDRRELVQKRSREPSRKVIQTIEEVRRSGA